MNQETYTDLFIAHIRETVTLDETGAEKLIRRLKFKELKKKEFLIQPGQISKSMNFIAKG